MDIVIPVRSPPPLQARLRSVLDVLEECNPTHATTAQQHTAPLQMEAWADKVKGMCGMGKANDHSLDILTLISTKFY